MTDRMIPSVEDAALRLRNLATILRSPWHGHNCAQCVGLERHFEDAALALDMANAAMSDARRAEADEIRRSVAW